MRSLCCVILFISINNFYHRCSGLPNISETTRSSTSNFSEGVSETQHATCSINTEQLVASAQATVTRVLTGVCNSEVMDERFENLESVIRRELDDIKQTLNSLRLECAPKMIGPAFVVNPRQEEIDRLNNTIQRINTPTGVEETFVYFMRVKNFSQKMSRWESRRFERSPTLYLPQRRYAMYVKVTPRDDQGRVVYVNVGAGLTRGIYDETLQWPFSLKHRVEILDHSSEEFRRDVRPALTDPSTSGSAENWAKPVLRGIHLNGDNPDRLSIGVPTNLLLADIQQPPSDSSHDSITTKYIWKGDLTVKLTVYL